MTKSVRIFKSAAVSNYQAVSAAYLEELLMIFVVDFEKIQLFFVEIEEAFVEIAVLKTDECLFLVLTGMKIKGFGTSFFHILAERKTPQTRP